MKIKNIIPVLMVAAVSALLISGCAKPRVATAPQADTELQSSVDVTSALLRITDAEMMVSFLTENPIIPVFYVKTAASQGSVDIPQDNDNDAVNLIYNNALCVDGHLRDGTVFVDRSVDLQFNANANPNSKYYMRAGFVGKLRFGGYFTDGWNIVTTDADNKVVGTQACVITNNIATDNFNPATTKLSWNITGNFRLQKDNNTIFCKLNLIKTLVNTSDAAVFPTDRSAIHWSNATVAYTGKVTGFSKGNVPFTFVIDAAHPLTRDFTCTPNLVAGVTVSNGSVISSNSEFHPFKDGIVQFTTAQLYPREINYGGSPSGLAQCDNSGSITIKGISYPVDFEN